MHITPSQFIEAAYQVADGESVCVVRPGKKGFIQYEWNAQTAQLVETRPDEWYVCVSTVATPAAGEKIRRRKKDCRVVWVLMLDDVGTKAAAPGIHPSVVLETSQNNYQWLYFLHGVELDSPEAVARFEAQNRAVCTAGFGDPGAQGVSRVYRIPNSINRKPGRDNWQTRVVWWKPELVYTLDELLAQMGIEIDYHMVAEQPAPIMPEDVDDPVLDWLGEKRLLGGQTDEWHAVVCPWHHLHTTEGTAAGYSPLGHGDKPHLRGFHCFHGHCASRTISDFLTWVQQNGGPAANVVGTQEMDGLALTALKYKLSTQERMELIRNSLPDLRRNALPDVRLSEKGLPMMAQIATRANVEFVAGVYGIHLGRNLMTHEIDATFQSEELRDLTMIPDEVMRTLFDGCLRVGISNEKAVGDIACEIASVHDYHPMEDWIKSLKWDGKPRVPTLARSVQVDPGYRDLWLVYLYKWLIQAVQAVCGWRKPSQIGHVLTLVGEQGIGKTRWVGSLVPPEFFLCGKSLHLTGHNAKDSIMTATAAPVVELGELDTTFRQSDVSALNAFLTLDIDVYRVPYGRKPLRWPRTTSFFASVNKVDFLTDNHGNRRYWPVIVQSCHPEHGLDLGQLWAEVYHQWIKGEKWWLDSDQDVLRKTANEHFYAYSDVEQATIQYLEEHTEETTTPMNLTMFCEMLTKQPTRSNLSSIRRLLTINLGPPRAQVRNVRNAWMIPTKPRAHLEVAPGVQHLRQREQ